MDDSNFKFTYRDDRLKIAKDAGYDSIIEHLIATYAKTKSLRKTGKICGNLSDNGVGNALKKAGIKINGRGGANNPAKYTECIVDGCDRKPVAFGRCQFHYRRHKKGLI